MVKQGYDCFNLFKLIFSELVIINPWKYSDLSSYNIKDIFWNWWAESFSVLVFDLFDLLECTTFVQSFGQTHISFVFPIWDFLWLWEPIRWFSLLGIWQLCNSETQSISKCSSLFSQFSKSTKYFFNSAFICAVII